MDYIAPAWLPGGHLQTIYAAALIPLPAVSYRRERWETPDGDFIDLDWVESQDPGLRIEDRGFRSEDRGSRIEDRKEAPLVVLFHGLEGCSGSHYARALMQAIHSSGWRGVVVHFRGCSGEPNRLPRAYHSGDSAEVDWILRRLHEAYRGTTLYAVGVSLGGNVLLKWLGEQENAAAKLVSRACAVSAPVDLMIAGDALGRGFNLFYARNFLSTLKPKSAAMLEFFPGLFDLRRLRAARTLREFDDVVTAPLHGFQNTDDYWTRASSKPLLRRVGVPTLMINARNDPFLPQHALPQPHEVSRHVALEFPATGGHAGFVSGRFPGHLNWLPRRLLEFFSGT
ncbi:MAG: alpha/beta fold hydrolase [Betaproteobacteria bacterium]|nr:alpha/beta fold hydrolase [Betaproteobacteria bacterium]